MSPNILLICTDQQRYDALGAYGNPHIATPNLDRLAAEGVLFENCYVQNPVCAPSRASLMTGRYVSAHGLHANGVDIEPDAEIFTNLLADGGYDCGLVGKLHLGACFAGRSEPRLDDGFRVFRPHPGSSENAYHRWLRAAHPALYARASAPSGETLWDTLPTEAHYSHWIADETIEFLTSGRQGDKPFFFVANFFDPHHGFGAPHEYRERYAAAALPPPVTADGELGSKPPLFTAGVGGDRPGPARRRAALDAGCRRSRGHVRGGPVPPPGPARAAAGAGAAGGGGARRAHCAGAGRPQPLRRGHPGGAPRYAPRQAAVVSGAADPDRGRRRAP